MPGAGIREVTQATFREVLGHFCTGVTIITAAGDAGPVGFACQAFAAVSLDPPLVMFCPARTSRTWPVIESAGRFCVNVLAAGQAGLSASFGRPGAAKFADVDWSPSPGGAPVLAGALTWLEADIASVTDGGDHIVVLGRVVALGGRSDARPLLFHRGRYTTTEIAPTPPEPWFSWSHPDDWI